MSGVIRATGLAIIALIAGLQFLDAMGFDLAPLLASAGVAGIAIGLAAQNIVKDMFNGFLILVEGQFSVGDTVTIAGVNGVVEALTLRKTTVRDGNGTLYIIPNSQITTVANLSAGYSVATIHVSVDFSANPDEVQAAAHQDRHGHAQQRGIQKRIRGRSASARRRRREGFADDFSGRLQNPRDAAIRPHARVSPPRPARSRRASHAARRSQSRLHALRAPQPPQAGAIRKSEPESAAQDPTTMKPQEANPFSGE